MFNGIVQNFCFMKKEDFIAKNDDEGYIKCILAKKNKTHALIWVKEITHQRLSKFTVEKKDLVSKIN